MPGGKDSCNNTFVSADFIRFLAQDKIISCHPISTAAGLGNSQDNFAPALGLCFIRLIQSWLYAGGFRSLYNGFETSRVLAEYRRKTTRSNQLLLPFRPQNYQRRCIRPDRPLSLLPPPGWWDSLRGIGGQIR